MPNHIKNKLEFETDLETMNKILSKFGKIVETHFDKANDGSIICLNTDGCVGWYDDSTDMFEKRDKKPIKGIPVGYEKKVVNEYNHFPDFEKVIPPPENMFHGDLSSEKETELRQKGIPDWYNWQIKNWGTKWNSYSHKKNSEFVYCFETAWSGVPNIVEKIANTFPNVYILYKYSDEDAGSNCGCIEYKGDSIIETPIYNCSKSAYELAFELRPYCKEYYKLVNGKYVCIEED